MPLYNPGGGGGITNIKVSGGTLSALRSDLTFGDAGGVSFGLETNGVFTAVGPAVGGAPIATSVNPVASASSVGTVTRYAPEDHQHAGVFSMGASNVGNTAGNTTVVPGRFVIAGSNGITVSQETAAAGLNTLHVQVGAYLTTAMASNRGSDFVAATAGFNGTNASGTIASNSISVSVAAQSVQTQMTGLSAGISTMGDTAGTTGLVSNRLVFVGVNGLTLQQSVNGQSATLSLMAPVNFGVQGIADQDSNVITGQYISFQPIGNISILYDVGNTKLQFSVPDKGSDFVQATAAFAGTNASGTIASNGISVSVAAPGGAATRNFYDNLGPCNTIQGALGTKAVQFGTLYFFPLEPFNGLFDGNMTASTFAVDLSISGSSATLSGALSSSIRLGIYTVNSTGASMSLGLLNSVIMSWGYAGAATNNSTGWAGQRWLTAASSQWSVQPVFNNGSRYVVGMVINSAGASSAQSNTMLGIFQGSTAARSGFLGSSSVATWMGGGGQFIGNYGTATTGLPAGVNFTQINRQVASGNFVPHVVAWAYTNLTMF